MSSYCLTHKYARRIQALIGFLNEIFLSKWIFVCFDSTLFSFIFFGEKFKHYRWQQHSRCLAYGFSSFLFLSSFMLPLNADYWNAFVSVFFVLSVVWENAWFCYFYYPACATKSNKIKLSRFDEKFQSLSASLLFFAILESTK